MRDRYENTKKQIAGVVKEGIVCSIAKCYLVMFIPTKVNNVVPQITTVVGKSCMCVYICKLIASITFSL